MITKEFEKIILDSVLKNDQSGVSEFYIGLCNNESVSRETTMAEIAEITGNGYARIKINRDSSGWQSFVEQPDCLSARSVEQVFNPTGDWTPFSRVFLTTVASGTSGKLLAVTTALASPVVLTNGNKYPVAFELFLK